MLLSVLCPHNNAMNSSRFFVVQRKSLLIRLRQCQGGRRGRIVPSGAYL